LNEIFKGLVDLHLPLLGALAEDVGEHVFEIDVHLFNALVGDDFEGWEIAFASFDFDGAIVELAFAKLLTEFFAVRLEDSVRVVLASMITPPAVVELESVRGVTGGRRMSRRLFGVEFGFVGDVFELFFAHHFDGDLDKVADHGFDIAPDVADFGELGGSTFMKGSWRV